MKIARIILFAAAIVIASAQAEATLPQKKQKPSKQQPINEVISDNQIVSSEEDVSHDDLLSAKLVIDASAVDSEAASSDATPDSESVQNSVDVIKADSSKLPEDQIPVLANVKESKKSSASPFARLMTTLGVLTVLLGGAVYGLRRWLKAHPEKGQNTKIKIITQHHLGPKKSLAIVNVAGESILIGITEQNISMLKTLSLLEEELPDDVPKNFNRAMDDFQEEDAELDPRQLQRSSQRAHTQDDEDFMISGVSEIRDKVSSRLKNMRSF